MELGDAGSTIGATSSGVIGDGHGREHGPAVAAWAAVLPGARITPYRLEVTRVGDNLHIGGLPQPASDDRIAAMLVDPHTFPVGPFLERGNTAAPGFPLVGGRIDYVGGRQVAALVYQRGPHRINLLLWPGTASLGCGRGPIVVRQGFNLAHGRAAGMEFWAVSDLNGQELQEFVARWQHGAAPGEEGCA